MSDAAARIAQLEAENVRLRLREAALETEHDTLRAENASLRTRSSEVLEQQTATAEILRVIASSPTDLPRVLDAIARSAARLVGADYASTFRADGDRIVVTASLVPDRVGRTLPFVRGTLNGRALLDGVTVHAHDSEAEHLAKFPASEMFALGYQTEAVTPFLRRGVASGRSWSPGTSGARSPTSSSACWRRSRTRPSSPSRTRGCSPSWSGATASYPRRWSGKP
jgi:hypothetical protein